MKKQGKHERYVFRQRGEGKRDEVRQDRAGQGIGMHASLKMQKEEEEGAHLPFGTCQLDPTYRHLRPITTPTV